MLKEKIAELQLSHSEIARRAGIKQPYLTQLINGARNNPSIFTIVGIANALQLKPTEVFDVFVSNITEKIN